MVPRSAMGSVGGETHGSVTEGPAAPSADGDRDRVFFEDEAIRGLRDSRDADPARRFARRGFDLRSRIDLRGVPPGTPRRTLSAERARARENKGGVPWRVFSRRRRRRRRLRRGPCPAFVEVVEERGEGARSASVVVAKTLASEPQASTAATVPHTKRRVARRTSAGQSASSSGSTRDGRSRVARAPPRRSTRAELGFRRLRLFGKRRGAFVFFRRLIAHTLHEPRALEPVETAAQLSENPPRF